MKVWRITGDEIGPNGNGAYFLATEAEAKAAIKDFQDLGGEFYSGPTPILITNNRHLAEALNDAMGYGAS